MCIYVFVFLWLVSIRRNGDRHCTFRLEKTLLQFFLLPNSHQCHCFAIVEEEQKVYSVPFSVVHGPRNVAVLDGSST